MTKIKSLHVDINTWKVLKIISLHKQKTIKEIVSICADKMHNEMMMKNNNQ